MLKLLIQSQNRTRRRKAAAVLIMVFVVLLLMSTKMISGIAASSESSMARDRADDDNTTTTSGETSETTEGEEDGTETEEQSLSTSEEERDDDGVDDDYEDINERNIQVEYDEEKVNIESELKDGVQKDKIKIEFKISDFPEFKLEYESRSGSGEVELQFFLRFLALIQFEDINGDGTFSTSGDQILTSLALDSMTFLPIQHSNMSSGNSTLEIFNATTSDRLFSLQFYVSSEFTKINQAIISPTQIKIDIAINKFTFTKNSSFLALRTEFEANSEYDEDESTEDEEEGRAQDEKELKVTLGGFSGYFSWKEDAMVDGAKKPVNTTQDTGNQWLYLVYPQGASILHDPKIGVEDILVPIVEEILSNVIGLLKMSPGGYFLSMIIVTLVVVSSTILGRIRRRPEEALIENEV
ncbi:MAG: hypothetical protein ACFFE8_09725 [Candidatus Heimdallarchaeota archaeon]